MWPSQNIWTLHNMFSPCAAKRKASDNDLPVTKYDNFLWVCWYLAKNLSSFVFLPWKLDNHKNINTTFNYSISCQCATIWEKKSWGWGFLKTFAVKLSWGYFGTNPLATSTKYPQWKVVWIKISTFFSLKTLCYENVQKCQSIYLFINIDLTKTF